MSFPQFDLPSRLSRRALWMALGFWLLATVVLAADSPDSGYPPLYRSSEQQDIQHDSRRLNFYPAYAAEPGGAAPSLTPEFPQATEKTTCGATWEAVAHFDTLRSVIYGNGLYVAVGNDGTILTSPDRMIWTRRTSGTYDMLNSVTWGSNQFVVVGNNGVILTSSDGVTWTLRASGISATLQGVTWGGNHFVSVGESGTILTSLDGVIWTPRTSETTAYLEEVIWGGNRFVTVAANSMILTSLDGVTWTIIRDAQIIPGGSSSLLGVTWNGSQFIAVGGINYTPTVSGGIILTSPDGITWTYQTSGTRAYLTSVTWSSGQFVAVGGISFSREGTILTSPDGVIWTPQNLGSSSRLLNVTGDGSQFVAVGEYGMILTSADGVTWTPPPKRTTASSFQDVVWDGKQFVAVGGNGTILSSPDGVSWTSRISGTTDDLLGVIWSGSQFVAVGYLFSIFGYTLTTTILTSPDGVNWTPRDPGIYARLEDIAWSGSQFVAVGGNDILSSVDGVTWTPRNPESGSTDSLDLHSVTWSGNQFVAVGDNGVILSSVDGIIWTLRASDANIELYGVAWGNGQFLAVGYEYQSPNAVGVSNVILGSSDGVTWTPHQASDLLYGVTWGNGQFIAVGMRGAILTSLDGLTWASHEVGTGDSLQSAAWNGRHWIAVGGEIILRSNCSDEPPLVITAYEFTRVFPTGEEIFFQTVGKEATDLLAGKDTNWSATGYTFEVYPLEGAPSRTVEVMRFYGGTKSDGTGNPPSFFYTTDLHESQGLMENFTRMCPNGNGHCDGSDEAWRYEGKAYRIVLYRDGDCPSGTKIVYRLYNQAYLQNGARNPAYPNRFSNFRYTTESNVVNAMRDRGWVEINTADRLCAPIGAAG